MFLRPSQDVAKTKVCATPFGDGNMPSLSTLDATAAQTFRQIVVTNRSVPRSTTWLAYPLTLARRLIKLRLVRRPAYETPQVRSAVRFRCRDWHQRLRARKSTAARHGPAAGHSRDGRAA